MQVDILHRQHLRIAATGCPSFHSEYGAKGRFAQNGSGLLANFIQALRQTDRNGRLSFPGGRGRNRRNKNQIRFFNAPLVDQIQRQFGFVAPVKFYSISVDAKRCSDLGDGFQNRYVKLAKKRLSAFA